LNFVLLDAANHGRVSIRFGATVCGVDFRPQVRFRREIGRKTTYDVLIGTDGYFGVLRDPERQFEFDESRRPRVQSLLDPRRPVAIPGVGRLAHLVAANTC
jgi:2-polyprenyl-6-methoxyphenol hydroxylase-like FAD-dependent oxidoreductase